jgi:hypothetical protein
VITRPQRATRIEEGRLGDCRRESIDRMTLKP